MCLLYLCLEELSLARSELEGVAFLCLPLKVSLGYGPVVVHVLEALYYEPISDG